MSRGAWEILGVEPGAAPEEVERAYRRLVALYHPDRLEGQRPEVRAEGERRLREATEAKDAMLAKRRRDVPPPAPTGRTAGDEWWSQPIRLDDADAERLPGFAYNAQVRSLDDGELHATWPGPHAAAVWSALKRAHTSSRRVVQQVEWGAYECTLPGEAVRTLLQTVLASGEVDWRREPLETLDYGPPGHRSHAGHRARGDEGPCTADLGELEGLVHDATRYLVTAEIYVGLE